MLNKNVVNEVNFLVHLKLRGRRPDEMTYALSKDLHFAHLDVLFWKGCQKHECFLLFPGVRQEQDIYVRLIDSVTKQVKKSNLLNNF